MKATSGGRKPANTGEQEFGGGENTAAELPVWRRLALTHSFEWMSAAGLGVALVVLMVVISTQTPYFFTSGNFVNVGRAAVESGIPAAAMTLVLVCGELDLSVGAVFALGRDRRGRGAQRGLLGRARDRRRPRSRRGRGSRQRTVHRGARREPADRDDRDPVRVPRARVHLDERERAQRVRVLGLRLPRAGKDRADLLLDLPHDHRLRRARVRPQLRRATGVTSTRSAAAGSPRSAWGSRPAAFALRSTSSPAPRRRSRVSSSPRRTARRRHRPAPATSC